MTQKCLVNQYRISSSNSLQVVILFILPPPLPKFIVGRLQNMNVEAHRVEAFVIVTHRSLSLHSPTFVLTSSTSLQQWFSMTVGWVLQWPHVHLEMSNNLVIHLHDMFDSILGYGNFQQSPRKMTSLKAPDFSDTCIKRPLNFWGLSRQGE